VTEKFITNNCYLYYPRKPETLVRDEDPIALGIVLMRMKKEYFRGLSAYTRWNLTA